MTVYIPLYFFYLPAAAAFAYQLYLLYYGRSSFLKDKASKAFLIVLLLLTFSNFIGILSSLFVADPGSFDLLLRLYYVLLVAVFALFFHLSSSLAFGGYGNIVGIVNAGFASVVIFLFLFTRLILSGVASIGYSVTRVPGEAYWVFQSYAILMLVLTLSVLVYGYIRAETPSQKTKISHVLLAVFSLTLPILGVIILMANGVKVNAVIFMPIGIILFLGFVARAIHKEALFDIRFYLPFTARYELFKTRNKLFMVRQDGAELSAREYRRIAEKVYLLTVLQNYKGAISQREMAKKMGISESSLSKKLKAHGI